MKAIQTPVLLILAFVLSGCAGLRQALPTPTARVAGVRFADLNLSAVTLEFDVEVDNPYGLDMPLVDLTYGLATRGTTFLSGTADVSGSVPARSSRTVPVPVAINFRGLMDLVTGIKPGALLPYRADLGLSVDAPVLGAVTLPLSKEGELPIPAAPQVALDEVRWEGLSPTRATARVGLRLTNTNEFPLDLNALSYDLKLAGFNVAEGVLSDPVSFSPGAAQTLGVLVSFSPLELGAAAYELLSGNNAEYFVRGTLDAGSSFGQISLPFEGSGRVPLIP